MYVESRGHQIHYLTAGPPGRPVLLLIHGILQSAARWAETGYLEAFSDHYRVIALDLIGHGASDKPTTSSSYDLAGQVDDVVAVLDREDATTCQVWGYSAGAVLALMLASRHPERVSSAILGGIPLDLPTEARRAVYAPLVEALRAGDWPRFWDVFVPVGASTRALLEAANDPHAVAAWMDAAIDSAELVTPDSVPALVYMGEGELFLDDARQTARRIDADFAVIPGRGHVGAFQDLPAVEPTARAFLQRERSGLRVPR